jgi:tetratricopeptide (TPR) repeat protein
MFFAVNANAQTEEINKAKSDISELLNNNAKVFRTLDKDDANYDKTVRYPWGTTGKNIVVSEDGIVFTSKKKSTIIYFSKLEDYDIRLTTDEKDNAGAIIGEFLILLEGKENGVKLVDNLIFIQNSLIENRNSELPLFEPIAAQYRALKVKPAMSEEQRKFIVQANGFNEQKAYARAIELYKKAIETDQTSYPAAYSNLALLHAQINQFDAAIYYMKKYLMLVPEAEDARSCQDRIYLWEANIVN